MTPAEMRALADEWKSARNIRRMPDSVVFQADRMAAALRAQADAVEQVGLTDEQIFELAVSDGPLRFDKIVTVEESLRSFARAIESAVAPPLLARIAQVRSDALDEAAKVVEDTDVSMCGFYDDGRATLLEAAASIRALKDKQT